MIRSHTNDSLKEERIIRLAYNIRNCHDSSRPLALYGCTLSVEEIVDPNY